LPLKDYFSTLIYFEAFSPMIGWDLANLLLSYEKELKYLRENASHPLNLSKKKKYDIILNAPVDSFAKKETSYPNTVQAEEDSLGNSFEVQFDSIYWDCKA
jgi:hypothetical protein